MASITQDCECPICMETIDFKKNCTTTECGHSFHTNCLLKAFSTNWNGCPMCRDPLIQNNNDDDEESLVSEDDTEYSEDIRMDEYESESHLLRGFRWLFQQNEDEHQDSNEAHSIFDGNSMAITPNSLRNARQNGIITNNNMIIAITPTSLEYDLDEEAEAELENEWTDSILQANIAQEKIQNIETFLKQRKITYNELLRALVSIRYTDEFDFIEFNNTFQKIDNHISSKLFPEEELNDGGRMTINELQT